jgi:D-galactarolactone cycloisomerase
VLRADAAVVQVTTEDGAEGWGECTGPPELVFPAVQHLYGPLLLGSDALLYATHWERLYFGLSQWARRGVALGALSGLDIALWDLAGRLLGRSVSELMGGSTRDRLPCYATGLHFEDLPEAEVIPALVDSAVALVEAGYRGVKAQLGRNPAADVSLVRALRAALPQAPLCVDCGCAFDLYEALQVGRALEEANYAWMEDPFSPDHVTHYRGLSQQIRVPLMAGEWEQTRWDFQRLLEHGGVALPAVRLTFSGGITEALRIRAVAQSQGLNAYPIATGTALDVAACAHFLASDYRRPGSPSGSALLGYPAALNPIRDFLCGPGLRPEGGVLAVPTGPGLGVTVDPEQLKFFTVQSGEITL